MIHRMLQVVKNALVDVDLAPRNDLVVCDGNNRTEGAFVVFYVDRIRGIWIDQ